MKLLVFSDLHFDHVTHGVKRHDDVCRSVFEACQVAKAERVGAVLCLGDITDPDSGSPVIAAVETVVRVARSLSLAGIWSLWLAGNHDVVEDGSGTTTLSPLRYLYDPLVVVAERPGLYCVAGLEVLAFPFAATSHAYDPLEIVKRAPTSLSPWIAAGHLSVPGVIPGEETAEMPRGREVVLPVEALFEAGASQVFNGHYHRQQRTESGVWIPGSIARLTFNEEGNRPGFLVAEI